MRQYFTEGFYPSGAKNAADKLTPTAALVKATMINSAVSMTGNDNTGGPISPIPSNEQGWGRIRLDQSLVFTGGRASSWSTITATTWAAGATTPVTYAVQGVTAGQPLKVTLVWTDYPGVPDSPPPALPTIDDPATWTAAQLVNDLDLTVKGPSDTYLGNVFTNGASATGGTADRRNNVEQVLIASARGGRLHDHRDAVFDRARRTGLRARRDVGRIRRTGDERWWSRWTRWEQRRECRCSGCRRDGRGRQRWCRR